MIQLLERMVRRACGEREYRVVLLRKYGDETARLASAAGVLFPVVREMEIDNSVPGRIELKLRGNFDEDVIAEIDAAFVGAGFIILVSELN